MKHSVAEKRMEAQASLWEAITGLGEVTIISWIFSMYLDWKCVQVAFETGNYGLALEDFSSCLQARQAELPKDSRFLYWGHSWVL